jgi:hypothetical protein
VGKGPGGWVETGSCLGAGAPEATDWIREPSSPGGLEVSGPCVRKRQSRSRATSISKTRQRRRCEPVPPSKAYAAASLFLHATVGFGEPRQKFDDLFKRRTPDPRYPELTAVAADAAVFTAHSTQKTCNQHVLVVRRKREREYQA